MESELSAHSRRGRPLRVLHFASTLESGGAAKGIVELARSLEELAVETQLCSIGNTHSLVDTSVLRHTPVDLGCSVHNRRIVWHRWRRIREVVLRFKPDIIHSHLWPTAREVAWSTVGLVIPHLVHIRDTPQSFVSKRWSSRAKKRWLRYSVSSNRTQFVAVSDAARNHTIWNLGIERNRIAVVVNGVDLAPLLKVAEKRTYVSSRQAIVGTAARLVPSKGIRDLIEAFRQLTENGHRIKLRIAGDGSERARLQEQCVHAGLQSSVEFLGNVDYMPGFLASLDLFVLPSHSEGLPRVLIEAMATGIPVVTTNCEGVDNVAGLQDFGIVVPKRKPEALATAIQVYLNSSEMRRTHGESAMKSVREAHSISRVSREILLIYDKMMSQVPSVSEAPVAIHCSRR